MAECRYCKRDHFKIHKIDDIQMRKGYRYELYDPTSESYHDQNRCRQIEIKRQKAKEKSKKDNKMIPRIVHRKDKYFDTPYFEKPKKQEGIKQICSCTEDQVFPTMLQIPHYYFNTDQLLNIEYVYWCSLCGNYLSTKQTETYFSQELSALNRW